MGVLWVKIEFILEIVKAYSDIPIIFCGDFNLDSESELFKSLEVYFWVMV